MATTKEIAQEEAKKAKETASKYYHALLVILLFYLVLTPLLATAWVSDMSEEYEQEGLQSKELSKVVFEQYGVPFFILGFVLVGAIVGGMYLAKDELRSRRFNR